MWLWGVVVCIGVYYLHTYLICIFPIYRILAENAVKEVNKKIFHGLVNLNTLSLYSNQIRCVTPGAFDALVSLQSLNLIANPFNCNCHMAWFAGLFTFSMKMSAVC